MQQFVAKPSKWRIALFMLGAIAFIAAGLWMIGAFGPPPSSEKGSPATLKIEF